MNLENSVKLCSTRNAAFTESYTKNPFLFKYNYLTSIAACVNGKSIPANPKLLNFQWLLIYIYHHWKNKIVMKELGLQEMNIRTDSACLVLI